MLRVVPRLVMLLLGWVLVSCNKGNAPKLEGRWHGIKASGVAPDQLQAANLFATRVELEFHGQMLSVHVGDDKQSSPFRVVSDGPGGSLVISDDGDGQQSRETFTFTDDHTIEWAVLSGKSLQLAKE